MRDYLNQNARLLDSERETIRIEWQGDSVRTAKRFPPAFPMVLRKSLLYSDIQKIVKTLKTRSFPTEGEVGENGASFGHSCYLDKACFACLFHPLSAVNYLPLSEVDRNHHFERDVAPHVVDALTACDGVGIGIFQSAQVVLVGSVKQVVGSNVEFGNLLVANLNVGAGRKADQSIGRRDGLCVVGPIDVCLLQIAVESGSDIQVIEQ